MGVFNLLVVESIYFPSVLAIILMFFIVLLASVVQATLGMGYGLTAAPLLALVDPVFVPVPTILIGMISSTAGAWSERQNIHWAEVSDAVLGRLAGAICAALVLAIIVDTGVFMIIFGVAVGVAVLLSVFSLTITKSRSSLAAMGAVSGLMGTITGVGAPPLALLYQGSYAGEARPTLAAIFSIGCLVSALALASIGWLGITELVMLLLMLVPMTLGTWIGRRSRALVDSRYRLALLTVAGAAAIILILRGLLGN